MIIIDYIWRIFLPNEWPQDDSFFDHSRFKCDFHESNQWSGSGQIAIFETAGPHVHLEYIIACSSMFFHSSSNELGRNYLFGENACRFWPVLNMDCGIGFGVSPLRAASKFKATSYELFSSSTNFVWYSNHVGVMQWAHNSSAALTHWHMGIAMLLSRQVSDLTMWSRENVNHTTWGPGRVSTCNINRRLSTFDIVSSYFILTPWH